MESDEEEDEYNPLSTSTSQPIKEVDVKFTGDVRQRSGRSIVVAIGQVARIWGKGANFGEQIGDVSVNGIQVRSRSIEIVSEHQLIELLGSQVASLFSPSWTQANVIVSEISTRLPVWAMHKFSEAVIEALAPSMYFWAIFNYQKTPSSLYLSD